MDKTLVPFETSDVCTSSVANPMVCLQCRMQNPVFRKTMQSRGFTDPSKAVCPKKLPLNQVPPAAAKKLAENKAAIAAQAAKPKPVPVDPRSVASQPKHTAAQAASFLEAMLTSPKVSADVEAARLAICDKCEHLRIPKDGTPSFCGLCGCQVSKEAWRVRNLAAYTENLPKWGCKHPQRGWKRPDGSMAGWPK